MGLGPTYSSFVATYAPSLGAAYSNNVASVGPAFGPAYSSIVGSIGPAMGPAYGLDRTFKSNGIGGEQVRAGTLYPRHIRSRSMDSGILALNAIGPDVLANNAITTAKIAAGAITTAKIAAGAVGSDYLQDGAVVTAKLAGSAVTTAKIASNAVATSQIQDDAVTPAKLDRDYQEALGTLTRDTSNFADITAFTATTPVEVNDEDAASFPDGSGSGLRVSFEVPADIDVTKEAKVLLRISPSTSAAGGFRLETDHRKNGGALQGAENVTVTPSATADEQTLVELKTFAAGQLQPGDGFMIYVKRLGFDGVDTHTGAMRLFRVILRYGV